MTTTQDDGGPAFPQHDLSGYGIGPSERVSGISVRDWFATFAPQPTTEQITSAFNLVRAGNPHGDRGPWPSSEELAARIRYQHADAMLAARKEPSR